MDIKPCPGFHSLEQIYRRKMADFRLSSGHSVSYDTAPTSTANHVVVIRRGSHT